MPSRIETKIYGEHFTPVDIFQKFIFPYIKDRIYDHIWVDLFAGEGNLILPILNTIPTKERIDFFIENIFLFDIQEKNVYKAIEKAQTYGIPEDIAKEKIIQKDTLKDYPQQLLKTNKKVFHITNPPYLYLGHIPKNKETQKYLEYFRNENKGYQDLYQIAMINDLRAKIQEMIYIIPTNFLFGYSVANKIRKDFLRFYKILKAFIFEENIFETTGQNVMICFFSRKDIPKNEKVEFNGIKIKDGEWVQKRFVLLPENNYRAGGVFEEFVKNYKAPQPLSIKFYLTINELKSNTGSFKVRLVDANNFKENNRYQVLEVGVDEKMCKKIKSNDLFLRTLDTGGVQGRVGLYSITEVFEADGIVVTKEKHRTHPIQVFIEPPLTQEEQKILKNYFNMLLEYFRKETDSDFLTTYKYSSSPYTRKYLGLKQSKALIETLPLKSMNQTEINTLKTLINQKKIHEVLTYIKTKNKEKTSRNLYLFV
ncbi:MAG: N-6 DNA methylase [Candidatus Aenigmarchaeota archaeon]|nr:N-6 DNA methylase [Candidatus Aenigmarchaeota archaeon]MDW8149078.1 N-6 DNA methylase [Candidatus Aenigmarchaeota archaeon]